MKSQSLITNRYQLLQKIGQGGMGVVYKAYDRLTGQTIALKQVLMAPSDFEFASRTNIHTDFSIMLAQEFRTLASIHHPNIINVLDYGFIEGNKPFFTMEYLDNAQNIIETGSNYTLNQKIGLIIQLLQALTYLHRRKIIHRDLKPDNVFVINGIVKTLDFGLAIIRRDSIPSQTDNLVGTIVYMALEIFNGNTATTASDLWAVGIIMYRLISGIHPFKTHPPLAILNDLMSKNADVDALQLPEQLSLVLKRLLLKDPVERYNNAFDVIDDLNTALGRKTSTNLIEVRESFIQSAKFIGREQELSQLQTALDNILKGQGGGWLIGGESGVGKTRLLEELRTYALVQGITVLRGQGTEGGGLPFQLWRNVIRRLALVVNLTDNQKLILKEIIPDIETLLGQDISTKQSTIDTIPSEQLTQTIVDVLKGYQSPTLLILEDIQWMIESIEPIKQLASIVEQLPLLIVCSYRNDEKPELPETLNTMNTIMLPRLDDNGIEQLSISMLGEAGKNPQLLDMLKKETEGNCLFMVEVVRVLAEEAGHLENIDRISFPEQIFVGGIEKIIQKRVNRLPELILTWLKPIAIMNRQLDLALIDQLLLQFLSQELSRQIDNPNDVNLFGLDMLQRTIETTRTELLTLCASTSVLELVDGQWQFSHDKLRDALLVDLSEDERRLLHQEVAQAIEIIYPDNTDYNEILLEHWHQANNIDKEVKYLAPVAEYLINIMAEYDRARNLLERGLQHLSPNDMRRIKLTDLQIRSHIRQGTFKPAQLLAEEIHKLAEQSQNPLNLAITFNSLAVVAINQGNYKQSNNYFYQSLNIYREIGDNHQITTTLNGLGAVTYNQGKYEESFHYLQESLIIATETGIQHDKLIALTLLGYWYTKTNNNHQASLMFYNALVIGHTIHAKPIILWIIVGFARIYLQQNNFLKASQLAGLAQHHPAHDNYVQMWLNDLQPELAQTQSQAELKSRMEHGKSLDLDTVIQELLDEFEHTNET